MTSADRSQLRPLERAVLRHVDAGRNSAEIAWRFRRTPRFVDQVRELTSMPRTGGPPSTSGGLRPFERCVLRAREDGVDYAEIAARFRRSPGHVARVEQLAGYKLRTGAASPAGPEA